MTNVSRQLLAVAFIFSGLIACSTAEKSQPAQTSKPVATNAPSAIAVHVKCINQEFSTASNLTKHENKFIVVPYKKLKTPGKSHNDRDTDDTNDLYFERVSRMAEKILTDAGLQKAKPSDKDALIVGLSWETKKRLLGWKETGAFANSQGHYDMEKLTKDQVYLSNLFLKAVGPDRKTTRWEVEAESANTDTFYMTVLPPLFAASSDLLGKNCDAMVEKSIALDSAALNALKSSAPSAN